MSPNQKKERLGEIMLSGNRFGTNPYSDLAYEELYDEEIEIRGDDTGITVPLPYRR